jgi:hypothetical protein
MPDTSPELQIDEATEHEAAKLSAALLERHTAEVEDRPNEILEAGGGRRSVEDRRARLTRPLDEISREVPMPDVLADVQDFGVLAALARSESAPLFTVLRIGEDRGVVPVLPPLGLIEQSQRIGWPFPLRGSFWFIQDSFSFPFDKRTIERVPWNTAREGFFAGLRTFLTARIGGERWWRSQGPQSQQSGGGGGTGTSGSGRAGTQLWTVETDSLGLALSYHGTHAARWPPMALPVESNTPRFTTPVVVHLPIGTLYLGADAGDGGKIIFDYRQVVVVPSPCSRPLHRISCF